MKIPLFKIAWNEDDVEAVTKIIRSGSYWCTGKEIAEFEKEIEEYLDVKHCVVFNSGGSALHALMDVYDFGPKDEIIVPSFTFIATAYAPLYVGAKPIFADIDEQTYGLDPDDVRQRISPRTKAIMPIHYGGMPCRINEIKEIAEEHGLVLLEDAAQAFGAKYKRKKVGTFGESSIFSFCQNKIFTTSEGGCVVTDNGEVFEKLDRFRSYGRVVKGNYFENPENLDYINLGYNFRMSTLLASLGISQVKRVQSLIDKRRAVAEALSEGLEDVSNVITPNPPNADYYSVYQMYSIRILHNSQLRNQLAAHLSERGITTRIYHDPVHRYSVFKNLDYDQNALPVTDVVSSEILTLPMYPDMSKPEVGYLLESIQEFF